MLSASISDWTADPFSLRSPAPTDECSTCASSTQAVQ
jgi:hypothetical protein